MESEKDEKICEACIFCYSGMLEASGYILCGKYLSKNLIQNWNSKLGWMEVNHEKPVQERVRFLNAAPVFAFDKEGEEHDRVIYLIHGRMIGYYINTDTGEVVRGKTSPETFYEYWVFIREDGRWVLDEIRQKDEVDVERL